MKSRKATQKHVVSMYAIYASMLATEFVYKYFGKNVEYYWVGDDIGGVLSVNDYYFNFVTVYAAMKMVATKAQLFAWYDDSLASAERGSQPYTLENFVKYVYKK